MSLISLLSSITIVVGLAGILPQLHCMVRAQSSAGQSALGWSLGAGVNVLLTYVNLVGNHAVLLAVGNVVSAVICLLALALVRRYGAAPAPAAAPALAVAELPTTEFVALRDHLEAEARRRGVDERFHRAELAVAA